jgi:hypothetical protein
LHFQFNLHPHPLIHPCLNLEEVSVSSGLTHFDPSHSGPHVPFSLNNKHFWQIAILYENKSLIKH